MNKFEKWVRSFHFLYFGKDDPIKHCGVYLEHGCSHVDGVLCDVRTCPMLKEYNKS